MKKLKKPARYAALAIVILFGLTYIYLRFIVRDIEKIDDSKMELKYTSVPAQENAFPLLVMAEVPLNDQLNENLLNELKTIDEELEKNNGRLTPKVEKLVNLHFREKIALLERAANMKYSQATNIIQLKNGEPWNQKILNYLSLRTLARVRLAMARKDFENGQTEEAVNGVLTILKLGSAIQHKNGGTSLISLMVGEQVKQSAIASLNEFLSTGYVPADGRRNETISILDDARDSVIPWENTWKSEYKVCSDVLDAWKDKRINLAEYIFEAKSGPGRTVGNVVLGLMMKPEKARKKCLDLYTRQLENSKAGNYSELDMSMPKADFSFGMALHGDLGSSLFEAVVFPNFPGAFKKKSLLDFFIDATRLRIAFLSYHKENGRLPEKLDDLAPDFIPEIPNDPFDGKPLRYDRKFQIIYSTGLNFKDDGGKVQGKYVPPFAEKIPELLSRKDLVVKISN